MALERMESIDCSKASGRIVDDGAAIPPFGMQMVFADPSGWVRSLDAGVRNWIA